jgi:transcriptional regulator with XRE-family HTH domain
MSRNFKEARLLRNLKITEVAAILDVAQSTISSWESGRLFPTPENLIKLSKLYGVSIDYLIGNSSYFDYDASQPIPKESYIIFHGKPVWSNVYRWVLINSQKNVALLSSGEEIELDKVGDLFVVPSAFSEPDLPMKAPLKREEIKNYNEVWLELISSDITQRETLRGTYKVQSNFVEDERGIRFFFSSYGAAWLAYELD